MRYFEELRKAIRLSEVSQVDIATAIDRSPMYVSNCLNRKHLDNNRIAAFTQQEMYKIMDLIEADYADMPVLFPKDGLPYKPKKRPIKETGIRISEDAYKVLKSLFQ